MKAAALLAVVLSTHAAAAHVAMSLKFTAWLQCGQPRGAVVVAFPGSVPASIDPQAVRLNGAVPGVVAVNGHAVTVKPVVGEVTCMSIARGPVRVVFTAAAGLTNPARAGTYTVVVRNDGVTYRARVRVG